MTAINSNGDTHGRDSDAQLMTPVLFLVFKRADTTSEVFKEIRRARPTHLYVAADGPRPGRDGEEDQCAKTREVATNVDWPCEIKTLFREENLGCRLAVSGAIDWFFEHEERGIILEDDCVPDPSFFPYVEELLERYKDDERIVTVSAQHFHGDAHQPPESYFFSRYNHCWGWATWKRAWQHYDHDMALWPKLRNTNWLDAVGNGSHAFREYWTYIFDKAYNEQGVDAWGYRWTMSCWAQNGLSILPAKNLVTNIGFGEEATHTTGDEPDLPLQRLSFPLIHPECVIQDVDADRWSDVHVFGITRMATLKRKVRSMPGGSFLAVVVRLLRRIKKAVR